MARKAAFYRGPEGRERADREREQAAARNEARKNQQDAPFRFYCKVGETKQFIICDDAPDFFRYEHNLKNPQTGKWDTFTGCVKEFDHCAACEVTGKESYYAMYFTIIDLTPYETRDGKTVDFSRKLLVVKPAQQKKFQRMYDKAEAKGNTLRGALIEVTRDSDKDASIGNEIELLEYIEEDDMEAYTRTWKDREGKKHTEVSHEVLDYEAIFGEPDAEQIRALVGGEPVPGSRAHERSALGRSAVSRKGAGRNTDDDDDDEDGADDDADWDAPDRSATMKAKKPSRGRGGSDDDSEDDDDAPAPRKAAVGRSGVKAKPAPTKPRRAKVEEDESEDDDADGEEDAPAPRRRAGSSTSGRPSVGATKPARKAAVKDAAEEDEEEDDDAEATNRSNPRRLKANRK